jgi:TetR/AcrR family transcriptional regulator
MPRQNRKKEILITLLKRLASSRSSQVSTSQLASEIGISEAALYRHFPSKIKIYESLLRQEEENLLQEITKGNSDKIYRDLPARCRHIIQIFFQYLEANPGLVTLLISIDLNRSEEKISRRAHRIFRRLEGVLKEHYFEKRLDGSNQAENSADVRIEFLIRMVKGYLLDFADSNFKTKPSERLALDWFLIRQIIIQGGVIRDDPSQPQEQ